MIYCENTLAPLLSRPLYGTNRITIDVRGSAWPAASQDGYIICHVNELIQVKVSKSFCSCHPGMRTPVQR
jgi:hypothetical protein